MKVVINTLVRVKPAIVIDEGKGYLHVR